LLQVVVATKINKLKGYAV